MFKHSFALPTLFAVLLPVSQLSFASQPESPPGPEVPLDCGVWAYNPYKSGSYVYGRGYVECDTAQSTLKVKVELVDSAGRHFYKPKTCYSTSYCEVTAKGSYVAGRDWQTRVSGYMGPWNGYWETDWIHID